MGVKDLLNSLFSIISQYFQIGELKLQGLSLNAAMANPGSLPLRPFTRAYGLDQGQNGLANMLWQVWPAIND